MFGEEQLSDLVDVFVRIVEAAGAIVIFIGALTGFVRFLGDLIARRPDRFNDTRLYVARFLALGLEFQLASDLLHTAIAPSFEAIGKLAAVAAIRTGLNFFLTQEMKQENQEKHRRDTSTRS
jgi:uncharacterized membrane protein